MCLFGQESQQLYFIGHYNVTWLRALYLSHSVVYYIANGITLRDSRLPVLQLGLPAWTNWLNSQPTKITNQRRVISGWRRGVTEICALLARRVKISINQPTNKPTKPTNHTCLKRKQKMQNQSLNTTFICVQTSYMFRLHAHTHTHTHTHI